MSAEESGRGADEGPGRREGAAPGGLSHLDEHGAARMVDVSRKADTERVARAAGFIAMQPATLEAVRTNALAKGDVLAVARVAGYLAAKRTAELIPLCHPLPLTGIEIGIEPESSPPGLRVTATVRCLGKTGVEMEALTAVSICLLTLYDMVKGVDAGLRMSDISLLSKIGGKSGTAQRP